jgi:hypothetical protein
MNKHLYLKTSVVLGALALFPLALGLAPEASATPAAPSAQPALVITPAGAALGFTTSATPASAVTPDSHSGCNGNTCIDVYGSGLVVTGWDTYAQLASNVCGYAYFYVNGTQVARSASCYKGDTPTVYMSGLPKKFANGTELCNEWAPGGTGYPCAEVES